MPTFPVGVETCQIVYGKGISPTGNAQKASLQIDVVFGGTAQAIVWAADGTPLLKLVDSYTSPVGETGAAQVPVVDQAGWVDGSQDAYSMWAYRLTERVGSLARVKYVQPLAGQTLIDFDLIPDGTVGLPVSAPVVAVTDVNGQTGSVTIEGATDEATAAFIGGEESESGAAVVDLVTAQIGDAETPIGGALLGTIAAGVKTTEAATLSTRQQIKQALTSGLARRDSPGFDIVNWGTSMTEGGPVAMSGRVGRWQDREQAALRARFPLLAPVAGGAGYIPAFFQTFLPGGTQENARVTPTGISYSGVLTPYSSGLGNRALGLPTGADWIQFTITGDSFDLFGSTHTTANANALVSIDGAAAETWVIAATTLTSGRFRKTGLSAGSHTVRVTGGGAGVAVVDGIMQYVGDRDKGIHVWDAGKGSAKISDFGADSSSRIWQPLGFIQPRVLRIEYGFNEYFGNIAPATFKTSLQNAVGYMRARITVPPTVQFIVWPEPSVTGGQGANGYQPYVDAIYEAAAATPNAFVTDLRNALPRGKDANTLGIYFDGVHFSGPGQAAAGDLILEDLLSRMAA